MIFTSEYWLVVSLCGAFFTFFALNRGGVAVFIEASVIFLFINLLSGEYKLKQIPLNYWVCTFICAWLLIISVLFFPQVSHYKWMANVVRMVGIIFAIHCLSTKKVESWVPLLYFVILSLAVCWQLTACFIFKKPFGTFANIHYIGSFTILALPILGYSFFSVDKWYRYPLILIAIMDLAFIFKIGSRPAIVGITFSTLFVIVFLSKGLQKWIGLSTVFLIAAIIFLSGYGEISSRFEELIVNLAVEERVPIWMNSWRMLMDNTLSEWIFGHGIGSSSIVLPKYLSAELEPLIHPHNYLLEILYDNGIVGAILVFGGIVMLLIAAMRAALNTRDQKKSILLKCMIVAFISWLIHTGLTFPFYSKYSQNSLAPILGILLYLVGVTPFRKHEVKISKQELPPN